MIFENNQIHTPLKGICLMDFVLMSRTALLRFMMRHNEKSGQTDFGGFYGANIFGDQENNISGDSLQKKRGGERFTQR